MNKKEMTIKEAKAAWFAAKIAAVAAKTAYFTLLEKEGSTMKYTITDRDTNGVKDWTFSPVVTDDLTDFILYEYRNVLADYTYDISDDRIFVKCEDEFVIFYYKKEMIK